MQKHIFTIAVNCNPIVNVMLESYVRFHSEPIHVYCAESDIEGLLKNDLIIPEIFSDSITQKFSSGHHGTATVLANVIMDNEYIIHVDSDIVFKEEALSAFDGFPDIAGTRRCYKNNPGKSPVADVEDAVSTYFMALNTKFIRDNYSDIREDKHSAYPYLTKMCEGAYNPLGFPCLDFFDPVFFYARSKGAQVTYLDNILYGGQNVLGSKASIYKSNMHLDMGKKLAHFGGVASGWNYFKDPSGKNESYGRWALGRIFLFSKMFLRPNSGDIGQEQEEDHFNEKLQQMQMLAGVCEMDSGRWVSGIPSEEVRMHIVGNLYENEQNSL